MRPHRSPRRTSSLVALVAVMGCSDGSAGTSAESSGGTEGTGTGGPLRDGDAADLCGQAPRIGQGRAFGELRGNSPDLAGACGQGGPDAFFRVEVAARADVTVRARGVAFTPRLGVLAGPCALPWEERTLLCTQGLSGTIPDLPSGTELVVSVGIDPDDPALQTVPPAPDSPQADPLAFVLDVTMRRVLEAGEICEPQGLGRCVAGTACLVDPESPGAAACVAIPADTCQRADAVAVPATAEGIDLMIDPATLQTDAHEHSCTGARRPERVVALSLPEVPGGQRLLIDAQRADVGLAVRAPGCLASQELGCVAPSSTPAMLDVAITEASALLFIELPPELPPAGEEPPFAVTVRVAP